jgi:hypothetical protein
MRSPGSTPSTLACPHRAPREAESTPNARRRAAVRSRPRCIAPASARPHSGCDRRWTRSCGGGFGSRAAAIATGPTETSRGLALIGWPERGERLVGAPRLGEELEAMVHRCGLGPGHGHLPKRCPKSAATVTDVLRLLRYRSHRPLTARIKAQPQKMPLGSRRTSSASSASEFDSGSSS